MASTREEVTPWFCVKSTLLGDASPGPAPELQKKVFLNICTRPSVSKPPELTDDVLHYHLKSPSESDPYLIPIVLAEPREDVDKAGKPCLVIDCIINPENKTLEQKHGGLFKTYLIGVVLDDVERKQSWQLSREISTPNIVYKGQKGAKRPRSSVPPKVNPQTTLPSSPIERPKPQPLYTHNIIKSTNGNIIEYRINLPNTTKLEAENATLDLEPRRVIFESASYALDIALPGSSAVDMDAPVDAEFRTGEKALVVRARLVA